MRKVFSKKKEMNEDLKENMEGEKKWETLARETKTNCQSFYMTSEYNFAWQLLFDKVLHGKANFHRLYFATIEFTQHFSIPNDRSIAWNVPMACSMYIISLYTILIFLLFVSLSLSLNVVRKLPSNAFCSISKRWFQFNGLHRFYHRLHIVLSYFLWLSKFVTCDKIESTKLLINRLNGKRVYIVLKRRTTTLETLSMSIEMQFQIELQNQWFHWIFGEKKTIIEQHWLILWHIFNKKISCDGIHVPISNADECSMK